MVLEELRHPCLELAEGVSYIPNDVVFKRGTCVFFFYYVDECLQLGDRLLCPWCHSYTQYFIIICGIHKLLFWLRLLVHPLPHRKF